MTVFVAHNVTQFMTYSTSYLASPSYCMYICSYIHNHIRQQGITRLPFDLYNDTDTDG